jgi:Spy/CpxP family protein refolding chaperone
MLNFNQNIKILIFISLFLSLSAVIVAQPAEHARERIEMLKKLRLLEILNLKENEADKFLVRYNTSEQAIKDKQNNLDLAGDELELSLRANSNEKEIIEKTNKMLQSQKELQDAMTKKYDTMKEVLAPKDFAKYVIFEKRFVERLRKLIMDKAKSGDASEQDDDFLPPKRKNKQR